MGAPEPPLPVVAGRFRATGLLGTGGSATVYRALDDQVGGDVALKLFSAASDMGSSDIRRQREIQVLRSLDHPGVVSIIDGDPGQAGAPPFIATEYVDGPTLSRVLQGGPIPELDAARLGAELAEALAYVHSRGIVHRDVKPANILLAGPSARGMLIDFGIALASDETRLTTESLTSGTAGFLSPEQVRGEDIGPSTDIYGLGLVLIESVTGERCYPGGDASAALARLFRQPTIPNLDSALLEDLLARMVALDPAERPTAEDAAYTLRGIGDGSLTDELLVLQSRSPARRRRRRMLMPAAAAAAIAASTAGIMLGIHSSQAAGGGVPSDRSATQSPPPDPSIAAAPAEAAAATGDATAASASSIQPPTETTPVGDVALGEVLPSASSNDADAQQREADKLQRQAEKDAQKQQQGADKKVK